MSLPRKITATLLLHRPPKIGVSDLLKTLNDVLAPAGVQFERKSSLSGTVLSSGGVHAVIRLRDVPVPESRLTSALSSELQTVLREDWNGLVVRHNASVTISVGMGPEPGALDDIGDSHEGRSLRELFELMLIVGHVATTHLTRVCSPLAIHWEQSDQIFVPVRFLAMADMLFPLPLFIHPRPIFSTEGSTQLIGIELVGSEHLIGCNLNVAASPAPFEWLMQRAYAFIAHVRASGTLPVGGTAFALHDGEQMVVRRSDDDLTLILVERSGKPVVRRDGSFFEVAA